MKKTFLIVALITVFLNIQSCGTLFKITQLKKEKSNNIDYIVVFTDILAGGMLTFFTSIKIANSGVFIIAPLLIDFVSGSIYLKKNTTSIE